MNLIRSVVRLVVTTTLWGWCSCVMAIVMVANDSSVLENALTANEVKQVFTLEKIQWKNKKSIVVFVLPANDLLHKVFCEEILEIYPHQLQRMWERHLFSENNAIVYIAKDKNDLLKSVAMTPGAVSYIDEKDLGEKTVGIKKIEITKDYYKNKEKDITGLATEETQK